MTPDKVAADLFHTPCYTGHHLCTTFEY